MGKPRVEIDDRSGFCFGVVRAIEMAERALRGGGDEGCGAGDGTGDGASDGAGSGAGGGVADGSSDGAVAGAGSGGGSEGGCVFSLGDIVHNSAEVGRLRALGLETISHDRLGAMRGDTVLIRAHGEPPATYNIAARNTLKLVDATCPVVEKLQRTVVEAAAKMRAVDGQVVILGKKGHPEVVGLTGQVEGSGSSGRVIVVEGVDDLDLIDFARPVYLLSQTTQSLGLFGEVAREITARAADKTAVRIHDTICRQVAGRESHLTEFARRYDAVVFVSGKESSNGKLLYEAAKRANPASYMVEGPDDPRKEWFEGAERVGVCGATSTPRWVMEDVARRIEELAIHPTRE